MTANPSQVDRSWEYHPDARARARDAEIAALRQALGALVGDDLLAWGASIYEDHWRCNWCHAHGGDIDAEPGEAGHKDTCPWVLARAALARGTTGAGE